jgi:hypothetical protein
MTIPISTSLTLEAAHACLKQFDCLQHHAVTPSEPAVIRQALQLVANQSDYQLLGICADTFAEGYQALETYAEALGYARTFSLEPIAGPVYIKFNPKSGLCYVDSYIGEHRGVLVSCQSAYDAGINDMYGHLPLDLFVQPS